MRNEAFSVALMALGLAAWSVGCSDRGERVAVGEAKASSVASEGVQCTCGNYPGDCDVGFTSQADGSQAGYGCTLHTQRLARQLTSIGASPCWDGQSYVGFTEASVGLSLSPANVAPVIADWLANATSDTGQSGGSFTIGMNVSAQGDRGGGGCATDPYNRGLLVSAGGSVTYGATVTNAGAPWQSWAPPWGITSAVIPGNALSGDGITYTYVDPNLGYTRIDLPPEQVMQYVQQMLQICSTQPGPGC